VEKSSGYFIYATTVVKFVDDKNFRPTERLECICHESSVESPFGALDRLYSQILLAAPAQSRLTRILGALRFWNFRLTPCGVEELLGLTPSEVRLALRFLHSLLDCPQDGNAEIQTHHASFQDFLGDPQRAGIFYFGDLQHQVDLSRRTLEALSYNYGDISINRTGPVAL
jgi:hypothetical protein